MELLLYTRHVQDITRKKLIIPNRLREFLSKRVEEKIRSNKPVYKKIRSNTILAGGKHFGSIRMA